MLLILSIHCSILHYEHIDTIRLLYVLGSLPKRKFINFEFLSDFSNKSTYIFLLNSSNLKQFFCAAFLLTIPFNPSFYISFSFIICCTKSEIQKFIISKLFLLLKYILMIFMPKDCLYMNYIVPIRYIWHQIDKLHSTLLLFFVRVAGILFL